MIGAIRVPNGALGSTARAKSLSGEEAVKYTLRGDDDG